MTSIHTNALLAREVRSKLNRRMRNSRDARSWCAPEVTAVLLIDLVVQSFPVGCL